MNNHAFVIVCLRASCVCSVCSVWGFDRSLLRDVAQSRRVVFVCALGTQWRPNRMFGTWRGSTKRHPPLLHREKPLRSRALVATSHGSFAGTAAGALRVLALVASAHLRLVHLRYVGVEVAPAEFDASQQAASGSKIGFEWSLETTSGAIGKEVVTAYCKHVFHSKRPSDVPAPKSLGRVREDPCGI